MLTVLLFIAFTIFLAFFLPLEAKAKKETPKSPKYETQMKKLWQIAQVAMKERKPLRAEKALLTILKFDEKNAAAYNRLGIIYAKSKKYDEAVECFEIAQSLDNNPASIHNVGLIYLETGAYEKATLAFRQAIELEGDVAARYIALAKAEEKLGSPKRSIEALENAYELDRKVTTLRQILAIYESMGDNEAIATTSARIEAQIAEDNLKKARASKSPRRIVRTRTVARAATPAASTRSRLRSSKTASATRPSATAKPLTTSKPATSPKTTKSKVI